VDATVQALASVTSQPPVSKIRLERLAGSTDVVTSLNLFLQELSAKPVPGNPAPTKSPSYELLEAKVLVVEGMPYRTRT
jgi:hypothetical protein